MTAMARRFLLLAAAALVVCSVLASGGCASASGSASEREWARAECRNIIDDESRTKCLDRVDREYGSGNK